MMHGRKNIKLRDILTGIISAGMHCLSIVIQLELILCSMRIYYLYSYKIVSTAVAV